MCKVRIETIHGLYHAKRGFMLCTTNLGYGYLCWLAQFTCVTQAPFMQRATYGLTVMIRVMVLQ